MTSEELKERLRGKLQAMTDYLAGSRVRDLTPAPPGTTNQPVVPHNPDVSFSPKTPFNLFSFCPFRFLFSVPFVSPYIYGKKKFDHQGRGGGGLPADEGADGLVEHHLGADERGALFDLYGVILEVFAEDCGIDVVGEADLEDVV